MIEIYLIFIAVMSVIAFFAYLIDKIKAVRGTWRISEKVLLLLGFFGGALGAISSMQLFRHKTKHIYFYIVNILGLIWQVALCVLMIGGIFK